MCYDHTKKDSEIRKITEMSLSDYDLPPFANTKNLEARFVSPRVNIKYKVAT